MGSYLSKPETNVRTTCEENDKFACCTAVMQGWRNTQEDAHVAILDYDLKGTAFFAVFDGHGGEEVSKFCSMNLADFIKFSDLYKNDQIAEALEQSFLKFDVSLKEESNLEKLRMLTSVNDIDEIDEDEALTLKKEAQMELTDVLKNGLKDSTTGKNGESSSLLTDKSIEINSDENNEVESTKNDIPSENLTCETKTTNDEKQNGSEIKNNNNDDVKNTSEVVEGVDSTNDVENGSDTQKNEELENDKNGIIKSIKSAPTFNKVLKNLIELIEERMVSDDEESDEEQDYSCSSEESDEECEGEGSSCDDEEENDDSAEDLAIGEYGKPGYSSGTTAIVALIRNNTLYVANVGDSRCVLSREGQAIEMSEDHKPEDQKEFARITKAGGSVTFDGRINGGLNLSRAIGDHFYKDNSSLPDEEQMISAKPDVRIIEIDVNKDEFVFLACDGIWNSMSNQEVVDFINERLKENKTMDSICEELFHKCLAPDTHGDGSGCDNMTCVLIRLKDPSCNKRILEDNISSSDDHSEQSNKKLKIEEDWMKPGPSKA